MLTNERVLMVFGEYLTEDTCCEVVSTSRGYVVLLWDEVAKHWDQTVNCRNAEQLLTALASAYEDFRDSKITHGERDLTEEEERSIQSKLNSLIEQCRQ